MTNVSEFGEHRGYTQNSERLFHPPRGLCGSEPSADNRKIVELGEDAVNDIDEATAEGNWSSLLRTLTSPQVGKHKSVTGDSFPRLNR